MRTTTQANVIGQLETEFMPQLEHLAKTLSLRYPEFRIKAGGGTVGSRTNFQEYNVYIDCDREGSAVPEPNCVTLEICVRNLDSEPKLCDLGVSWGGDGVAPCSGTDHLPDSVRWSEEAIILIRRTLPTLEAELATCLEAWIDAYPVAGS